MDPNDRKGSRCFISDFQSRNVDSTWLRSWYAWTVDGTWFAYDRPRYRFANSRYLVKIQVVSRYPDRESMENDEETQKLVQELERTLKSHVFSQKNN